MQLPPLPVQFRPRKKHLIFELTLLRSDEIDGRIENAGFNTMEYQERFGHYRLVLTEDDVNKKADTLRDLVQLAYERKFG
jgi:hypothetical protein